MLCPPRRLALDEERRAVDHVRLALDGAHSLGHFFDLREAHGAAAAVGERASRCPQHTERAARRRAGGDTRTALSVGPPHY